MKNLLAFFNLIAGLILTRFTISKFAAWPESVASFKEMAEPLGIDPTFFRIMTGFIIGYATISCFTNAFLIFKDRIQNHSSNHLFTFNSIYVFGAMTGALFSEFFLRDEPKWPLVYIATGVIVVVLTNIFVFFRSLSIPFIGLEK